MIVGSLHWVNAPSSDQCARRRRRSSARRSARLRLRSKGHCSAWASQLSGRAACSKRTRSRSYGALLARAPQTWVEATGRLPRAGWPRSRAWPGAERGERYRLPRSTATRPRFVAGPAHRSIPSLLLLCFQLSIFCPSAGRSLRRTCRHEPVREPTCTVRNRS
jgi:hypothetical protein